MHTAEVRTNAFICSRYDSIITKKGMYPKLISRLISGKKNKENDGMPSFGIQQRVHILDLVSGQTPMK